MTQYIQQQEQTGYSDIVSSLLEPQDGEARYFIETRMNDDTLQEWNRDEIPEQTLWDQLYRQMLARPQEFVTLYTLPDHRYQQFFATLAQYYSACVDLPGQQESSFLAERELQAHYYFARAFCWSCLLYQQGSALAWSILLNISRIHGENIGKTLRVALLITEQPEILCGSATITLPGLHTMLQRIAALFSMDYTNDGTFFTCLLPPTIAATLHTRSQDPCKSAGMAVVSGRTTPLPQVSSEFFAVSAPAPSLVSTLSMDETDPQSESESEDTQQMAVVRV